MYSGVQRIDLHGKNRYQAKIILDSALRKAQRGVYRIHVIHGQTYGTELRDMVREEYISHSRVLRIEKGSNDGETILILRELK
jgi:DNA-nicking Smr family endonuclease